MSKERAGWSEDFPPFSYPAEGANLSGLHVLPDTEAHWTRDELAGVTAGGWVSPPPACWHAGGVALTSSRLRPGVLVCHGRGFSPEALRSLSSVAAGVLTEDARELAGLKMPVLEVADMDEALYSMARHSRDRYAGKVIALTGSAGKTGASYLLGQVLSAFGPAEHTPGSGNSPRANASLLASISRQIPFWIVEVSLNGPGLISSFARPHVALVLSIGAAHLLYWKDTRQVAQRKSAIFSGMEPGGRAVLNRDMEQYDLIAAEAEKKGLRIATFGLSAGADVRLLEASKDMARVSVFGEEHLFPCSLPPHMQRNMLGILAVIHCLGLPVRRCFPALRDPALLPGRGRRHALLVEGKPLTVIDDSYNANMNSMRAALEALSFACPTPSARVAVLGDIAELGRAEVEKHLELIPDIRAARPDRLLLCGPIMRQVWERVEHEFSGQWYPTPEDLQAELLSWLRPDDVVLFKSSGHRLGSVVQGLIDQDRPCAAANAEASALLAFGGHINLGRRQHLVVRRRGPAWPLGSLSLLREADLALAGLSCVAANQGVFKADKGFAVTSLYRARPEQLAVLREAGIGAVVTANGHSGDAGPDALLEQAEHLEGMGIGQSGSGPSALSASRPAYVQAGAFTLAVFSVDTTLPAYAAGTHGAGNWHLPPCNPDLWYREFVPRIAAARERAHIVLAAVNENADPDQGPGRNSRAVGRALVDAGVDAVLGMSSQTCPSLEIYKDRPLLRGTGDLLTDLLAGQPVEAGLFTLELAREGIRAVRFFPLLSGGGRTIPATGEAARRCLEAFAGRSRKLGTAVSVGETCAAVHLHPRSRSRVPLPERCPPPAPPGPAPEPCAQPRPEWVLTQTSVPARRCIEPVTLGPLQLRGYWIPSVCRELRGRSMIWVESYWSLAGECAGDVLLDVTAGYEPGQAAPRFGAGMGHDPCGWMWPTGRWQSGVIYKDIAGLTPPPLPLLRSGELRVTFRVLREGEVLGSHTAPVCIKKY